MVLHSEQMDKIKNTEHILPTEQQRLTWWTVPSISTGITKSALYTGCKITFN